MSPFVEGVRDLLPGEIRERRWVYQKLRDFFARDGYQEVATPTLESLDLYTGIETLLLKEQMLKVVDENGQILVLRPDLTMPIARLVATRYSKTPGPWKFSYISTAHQAQGGQSHQMREKTQAGVELIGRGDGLAEVEVIGLLIQALQRLGVKNPLVDLGQAALVEEIFAHLSLNAEQKRELRILMEEKNGQEIHLKLTEWGLSQAEQELIRQFPRIFGQPEEVLARLRQLSLTPKALTIVAEMEEIYRSLEAIGLGEYITFDPAMVTQLGYYTGTIFRAYVSGFGEVVASGGRYDGLTERFGLDVPAVGFAIEIERLMSCLRQFEIVPQVKEERLVIPVRESDQFVSCYQLANLLKEKGIVAELYRGEDLEQYCKFNQISLIGEWSADPSGTFRLSDVDQREKIRFIGPVGTVAQECVSYLRGGRSDAEVTDCTS